jgi:hypothetical protein
VKASSNIELRGSVTIIDVDADGLIDDAGPDTLVFNLASAAGGRPVLLDPAATSNTVVMNSVDSADRIPNMAYTVVWILGEGDDLLEAGERAEVTVEIPAGITLDVNEEWTVEVVSPSSGTLLINRLMPPRSTSSWT